MEIWKALGSSDGADAFSKRRKFGQTEGAGGIRLGGKAGPREERTTERKETQERHIVPGHTADSAIYSIHTIWTSGVIQADAKVTTSFFAATVLRTAITIICEIVTLTRERTTGITPALQVLHCTDKHFPPLLASYIAMTETGRLVVFH
ncbi:hypothetical protein VCV18_004884 [Metarhizium anisopliae]